MMNDNSTPENDAPIEPEMNEAELDASYDADLAAEIAAMAEAGAEAGEETPEQKIAALEKELEETKDRLLRMAAELDNTRRRAEKEQRDAIRYGINKFAGDLLSVVDNFQRAVETAPKTEESANLVAVNSMVDGIKMTEKELITVLERHGVTKIDPQGQKFDPNYHQAIAQVPGSNGEAKDHVVNVAQIGFSIGDRVLRAAMVTVSTGPVA